MDTRTYRHPERGAIVVLMALCLGIVMGAAALAFDLAYVRLARLQMQNAADAASHAAMLRYRATQANRSLAIQMAQDVAAKNSVLGRPVKLLGSDVHFGVWDTRTKPYAFVPGGSFPSAIAVDARISDPNADDGSVDLTFGKTMGFKQAVVARSSVSAFRSRGVMVAMDVTGSFVYPNPETDPPIAKAVAANVALLDAMKGMNVVSDRIGMKLFTGRAHDWTPIQPLAPNYSVIRQKWRSIHVCQKPGVDDWPPTGAPDDPQMPVCWEREGSPAYPYPAGPPGFYGGTDQGLALRAAADELLQNPAPYEVPVIVLVTDGEPMCCSHPQGGALCESRSPPCCDSGLTCTTKGGTCGCAKEIRDRGWQIADDLFDKHGISIFTVRFGEGAAKNDYNASLKRGFGKSYDTPDANDLKEILEDIARSIPVRLVR